jgi:hypothetical protein
LRRERRRFAGCRRKLSNGVVDILVADETEHGLTPRAYLPERQQPSFQRLADLGDMVVKVGPRLPDPARRPWPGAFLLHEGPDKPGAVIVCAAGNDSQRGEVPEVLIDTSPPAVASPEFISVGATRRRPHGSAIASFSNINPTLCAPGVDIVSADRLGGLKAMNGTSMACPHVAGLAALWWEYTATEVGRATGTFIRSQLITTARRTGFATITGEADRGRGCAMAPPTLI